RCARPPAGPRPPPLPPARRRARLVLGCEIAFHGGRAETRKRAGVTRGGRSAHGPRTDLPRVYRRVARAVGGRAESTRAGDRALAHPWGRGAVGGSPRRAWLGSLHVRREIAGASAFRAEPRARAQSRSPSTRQPVARRRMPAARGNRAVRARGTAGTGAPCLDARQRRRLVYARGGSLPRRLRHATAGLPARRAASAERPRNRAHNWNRDATDPGDPRSRLHRRRARTRRRRPSP